jgi:polysaccharide biosynthesis/export protein
MDVKMRQFAAFLVMCLVTLGGQSLSATDDVEGGSTREMRVESLSVKVEPDGAWVVVRTSAPVPPYECALPTVSLREMVLVMPNSSSGLGQEYDPKNEWIRQIRVFGGHQGSKGVELHFVLAEGAALTRIEQQEQGLRLRFEGQAGGVKGTADAGPADYRVGPGDKIGITVFGHQEMSQVVEVRSDGTIKYPMVGDLLVAGRSVSQIDDEITRILGRDYLVDPQVNVDVQEYRSQWVTILGEVRNPGRYVLKRDMRMVDLLAEAGGATKEAGSEILITRHEPGKDTRQMVVGRDKLLSKDNVEANIPLAHGDIVVVREQEVFYIRGQVVRPGAYVLDANMTVLKAISLAGGLTQFANRKEIELLRAGDGEVRQKMIVNLKAIEDGKKEDVVISPNDTLIVPRRIF